MEIGLTLPSETLWWLNRSTGLVLLALFTAVVVLGVFSTQKAAGRRIPTFVPNQLHRAIALFALAFLAAHILTAVLDDYVEINWIDVFVPFLSGYRTLWLGFGTLALDLTLAVMVTSWAKARISERGWQIVHLSSYLAWLLAVVHGLAIGTDARNIAVVWLNIVCVLIVAVSIAARVTWSQELPRWLRLLALAAVALGPIVLAVWALNGALAST